MKQRIVGLIPNSNWILGALTLFFVGSLAVHYFPKVTQTPQMILSLEKEWTLCLPNTVERPTWNSCSDTEVQSITVPHLHSPNAGLRNFHWLIYRTHFTAPRECFTQNCSFLATEIGDAAEISINGATIKVHGSFQPPRYAKHYPVTAKIPKELLRQDQDNLIEVTVYSKKIPQSGIRGSYVGITDTNSAEAYTVGRLIFVIAIPVLSAVALFILALPILVLSRTKKGSKVKPLMASYARANIAFGLFLLSFSEVPREYLPIWLAAHLHFLVRYVSDWAFFDLVATYFEVPKKVIKWFHLLYGTAVSLFVGSAIIQFFAPSEFQAATGSSVPYMITKTIYVLKIVPMVFGFFGALVKRKEVSRIFVPFFALLLAFQINDILFFLGYIKSIYFIKFYPLLIGFWFAYFCMKKYYSAIKEEEADLVRNLAIGEAASMYAHDHASFDFAYNTYVKNLKEDEIVANFPEHKIRLLEFGQTIHGFQNRFQNVSEKTLPQQLRTELIPPMLVQCISDKKMELSGIKHKNIELVLKGVDENRFCFAKVVKPEFKTVVSNILNNAIQAITADGTITVSLGSDESSVWVSIKDTGTGIPREVLPRIFDKGFTHGKKLGKGLGLYSAKVTISGYGGSIEVSSEPGQGAEFIIVLPRARKPVWFVDGLTLAKYKKVIVCDDYQGILNTWHDKLSPMGVDLKMFRRPSEFIDYIKTYNSPDTLILIDNEFSNEEVYGLDIIIRLKLQANAILVTSYANDEKTVEKCERYGVRLLPKSVIDSIPIERGLPKRSTAQIVLVDDDRLVQKTWEQVVPPLGHRMDIYSHPNEFRAANVLYDKSTLFFVDQSYGEHQLGIDFLHSLYCEGFENLYLVTGWTHINQREFPWIKQILSKEVPLKIIEGQFCSDLEVQSVGLKREEASIPSDQVAPH